MSKKDKLIKRLKTKPKDFTFDEMEALLFSLGFSKQKTGKTGGSRRKYEYRNTELTLHEPHPDNILKPYQVHSVLTTLIKEGLI